jgi:undecaprenyl-diphosphatase
MLASVLAADEALRAWFTTAHAPWLDVVMGQASLAGQAGFVWLVIGVFAALHRPVLAARLWQVVLAVVVCYALVDGVLKPAFARSRPFESVEDVRVVGQRPVTYSFPSGHAATAFASTFVLTLMLPRWRWWLWALAALVATSRVYIGVHYPLDVVAGALVGTGVGAFVAGGRACYSRRSLAGASGPQGA